ncbi:MAG TPA: TIGR04053 family radical SAM/SPASM domain-containing protein [Terriglobales bacterium]|nr:TIGR04053 family radical SAM/SPASM domain-containing protein [Terriglobales bacterium]
MDREMMAVPRRPFDFNQRPLVLIWETTQACDLTCAHCRACAQPLRHPLELSTVEARGLIDQVAAWEVPVFVLTGGDPLKRPDIYDIVEYSAERGVRASLTPSATPLLTREAIEELKRRGLARLAVSLDASTPEIHDAFRGVPGAWERALSAVRWASDCHLPLQINTTVTRRNLDDLDNMVALLDRLHIVLWSVFFLVPTGRGQLEDMISPDEAEQVFRKLWSYESSGRTRFHIKTTEGMHYRRFVLQQKAAARANGEGSVNGAIFEEIARARQGVNDAKGFMFVSHVGEVYPSGFLPLSAGNIRTQPLAEIYQRSPLFLSLRDPRNLKGKCGLCEFNDICGGSRARAYATSRDVFAEEPCCAYLPGLYRREASAPAAG